ncbi:glycosyltransferase involved in cell wall biosynthesis [Gelidibacter sediminis]|uniref:Glycosyltransferase involved in cell wall biosynthesis n=1 Tax=Gelidibacter sediminis TaxID=1608710 RepID=A0A4V3F9B0_9FLAO|nr:hypothetical protein [Gelidibacter sediminis]TDU43546.1 glycosyltransferase involved in cell wall biosynthesis [Gelidibacter sediminis]
MNLLVVPFHDWRKISQEGFRTRDAHFIEAFKKKSSITQIIINRPTTVLEIFLKRMGQPIQGAVIHSQNNFKLYQIEPQVYVIDYVSGDVFGQIFKGHAWFIQHYENPRYTAFIKECLLKLKVEEYHLLNQNIFAAKLSKNLKPITSIFDAWDNFTKFEVYKKYHKNILEAYAEYARICDFWITNSKDNTESFSIQFKPKNIFLIKNGVEVSRFTKEKTFTIPDDIKDIPRPIIGFGGKISHLIDVDLLNRTMEKTPNVSFVFVGQILDKAIYKSINKVENFYYVGDKHYDDYPNYVKSFDVGIVPYVIDKNKTSGANTIKVYEYLAANKKVVGTHGNGLEDLQDYVYIVSTADEFSEELNKANNEKLSLNFEEHTWDSKVTELLKLIQSA